MNPRQDPRGLSAAGLPGSTTVVTGGAGFIGSHLCEVLLRRGCSVICIDNLITGALANVEHLGAHPGFRLVLHDVTESFDVPGPVDHVLHLASAASPVDYLQLPVETLLVGSAGTLNALNLAERKCARFLLASTSEVYGDPRVHPQPESYWGHVNPVGPRAVYDEAKRYAEALTETFRRHRDVDTAIARIFNTHGPRMRPHDGRAVPTFVRQALAGEPLTVAGDGSQTRSMTYVDDLVEGVCRLLASGHPGPVNLGNPHEVTILDLAETIIRLCGSTSEITFVERPVDDPGVRRPDVALAADALDWRPTVAFEDGLARTIADLRAALSPRAFDRTATQVDEPVYRVPAEAGMSR